jgi:hypothetical protein
MSRPRGSRNRLVTLDYDDIGQLAGVRGNTARAYAHRGEYDSRSLDSVLAWVNGRRAAQRLSLIGLPDGDNQVSDDTTAPVETAGDIKLTAMAGGLVYDPMTGEFRGCDDG